ncbi:hypothetical protein ANTPLA_LOCUS4952 [Anthophora plagiata]
MENYSVEQRVQIIKLYYQNQCSVRATFRALHDFDGAHNRSVESTIRRLVNKFELTGSVNNQTTPTSAWRILRRDLGLHPYKIQLTQELKANEHRQRRAFADLVLEQLEVDPEFGRKIIFSDEAHFWMNGYVNKQNCRIWEDNNPHETHQLQMHPEKVTVWCGFWSGEVIGPYFFQNEVGAAITVTDERYRSMITNFLWPKLKDMDLNNMWFQQDGTTCHTAHATMDLLHDIFNGMIISCFGDVNWPPRSCDLMPLDFFLWGYVKSRVYANKPQTIDALKINITNAINDIDPDLCGRIIEN